jgi:diguanylate cyclase (GGDEF)-like protein
MSLKRRLTLFFVLPAIAALAAGGFVVQRVVVNEIGKRAVLSLNPALNATVALYNDRAEALDERIEVLRSPRFAKMLRSGNPAPLGDYLRQALNKTSNLDFVVVFDAEGRRLAHATTDPDFIGGIETPTTREIVAASDGSGKGFNRTPLIPIVVPGRGEVGGVIGGFWLDRDLLLGSSQDSVVLSLVADGEVVSSTTALVGPVKVQPDFDGSFTTDIGGESKARARELSGGMAIVASTPTAPLNALSQRVIVSMSALLLLAIIGLTIIASVLARLVTQPLQEVADGAKAISDGQYGHDIPIRSRDEVGRLAAAFNEMSTRLKGTVSELSSSRDQLQRAVRRVGETMRSTHDLGQMLESILNTSVDAVRADGGVLWRFTATREALSVSNIVGIHDPRLGRVPVGQGIVGHVAERATAVVLPVTGGPRPAEGEPEFPNVIAMPIYSRDRVVGVLALYRSGEGDPFTADDQDTVQFLAEQGAVAIENVQLHEEAKRLSLMDGLTGVWNRRFFQMQFRQVLATATRFQRPFSVLMMDLDNFKKVNDELGHQRGDAILIEFAQRVSSVLREVDTFARYGGEEFICLLSETDGAGARTTAQKICEEIRNEPFRMLGADDVNVTVSIGVASHPEHGDTFKDLVEAADKALYAAKEGGRDRVEMAAQNGKTLKLAK